MKIINLTRGVILADRVRIADTFWARLVGLLNHKSLEKGEALILKPSNSIHTLFMRFSIDVVFLDRTGKIIALLSSFRPFRISPIYFKASLAIEFPEGILQSTQTRLGDIVRISD